MYLNLLTDFFLPQSFYISNFKSYKVKFKLHTLHWQVVVTECTECWSVCHDYQQSFICRFCSTSDLFTEKTQSKNILDKKRTTKTPFIYWLKQMFCFLHCEVISTEYGDGATSHVKYHLSNSRAVYPRASLWLNMITSLCGWIYHQLSCVVTHHQLYSDTSSVV